MRKTAGTFLSGSPATKLEIALDGAWKVPEYWLSKPHLLISKIKLCVDEIVNDGFQNGGGRVSIKQIYDVLKAALMVLCPVICLHLLWALC